MGMGVQYNGFVFLSGGRDKSGVGFSDEVWRSADDGKTWVLAAHKQFGARAYHYMLTQKVNGTTDCMVVLGGQTFTKFYNDVWRSCDGLGEQWALVSAQAPWPARAGLGATVTNDGRTLVVAGGCYNKNGNPLARSFWGDVWASDDGGASWVAQTVSAEWKARSGLRLITTKSGRLLVVAGEVGFTNATQLVDIWGSDDLGKTWTLVNDQPGFSPRSGHGVVV